MPKNTTKVQQFLQDLENTNNQKFKIVQKLINLTTHIFPEVILIIKYGGIMFFKDEQSFGGIFVYKNHISLEFTNGYLLNDPQKLLEGSGKYRRHIKFKKLQEIENKQIEYFLSQTKNEI